MSELRQMSESGERLPKIRLIGLLAGTGFVLNLIGIVVVSVLGYLLMQLVFTY